MQSVVRLTMVDVDPDLVGLAGVGGTVVLAGLLGSTGLHHQVAAVVLSSLRLAPLRPADRSKYLAKLGCATPPLQVCCRTSTELFFKLETKTKQTWKYFQRNN